MDLAPRTTSARHAQAASLRSVRVPESLDVLRATYDRHAFAPHAHTTYVVGVLERGRMATRFEGQRHVAPAGAVLLLNPGDVHTGEPVPPRGCSYYTCYPGMELMQRVLGRVPPRLAAPYVIDPPLARELARLLARLWASGGTAERRRSLAGLLRAVCRLHGRGPIEPTLSEGHPAGIGAARAFIHDHYARGLRVEQLARLAGLSPSHFSRVFAAAIGLPPHQYLDVVRVRAARELLDAGMAVTRVVYTTGFCDQSHFTRRFKAHVGVPPGQYVRERLREPTRSGAMQ